MRLFRDHMAATGHSHKTIGDYAGWLRRIDRWARRHGVTLDDLTPYQLLDYVEGSVPMSRTARLHVRQAVRWYQEANGLVPTWQVVRVPAEDTPVCRALDPGVARTLYAVASRWEHGPEGLAVLLGQQQGMRRAEIAGLEWSGVTDDRVTFVGKGPKVATLPLHPVVSDRLTWWRHWTGSGSYRTCPGEVYVFQGRSGHVTPTTVWTWVKRVGGHAGIELTTHELRHTFGAEVNDRTHDLRVTQRLLRHSRSTTTERYTRVDWDRMVDAVMTVDYSGGDDGGDHDHGHV